MTRRAGTIADRTTNPPTGFSYFDLDARNVYTHVGGGSWVVDNRWRGSWVPTTYYEGHVVVDGGFLAVANTTTTERPAPQVSGPAFWYTDKAPPTWPDSGTLVAGTLETGTRLVFGQNGFLTSIRVWVPTADASMNYRARLRVNDVIVYESPTFTLADIPGVGWVERPLDSPAIIPAGAQVDVTLVVTDTSADIVTVARYDYETPNNSTAPLSGQITHANLQADVLRIHYIDSDAVDRTAALQQLIPGD
jgi:hypothetical protein